MGEASWRSSAIVALIGVWRCWRNRTLQLTAVILMVLPGILLMITGFDGEVLLRVMLFAAPFIAFNAATAIIPRGWMAGCARATSVATAVLTAAVAAWVLARLLRKGAAELLHAG